MTETIITMEDAVLNGRNIIVSLLSKELNDLPISLDNGGDCISDEKTIYMLKANIQVLNVSQR